MRVVIIGSGIAGLASACLLARDGHDVTVLEKNDCLGGRAAVFEDGGYRFDMGPSWYLMPDVFERFFEEMGEKVEDHLELKKLSPSYRVYFEEKEKSYDLYPDIEKNIPVIEELEPGAGEKFRQHLDHSGKQYDMVIHKLLYRTYNSLFDLVNRDALSAVGTIPLFGTMQRYISRRFKSDELQKLLQYTLVFLGSSPYNAPALYSMMGHVDFTMGVFYPKGGIYGLIEAMVNLGKKHGVTFKVNTPVVEVRVEGSNAKSILLENGEEITADIVISNAGVHHTETSLLKEKPARSYSDRYWDTRVMAPSALLMYLGVDGDIPELLHHTLYFCKDWPKNFGQLYDRPEWPDDPSYYVCAPSKNDPNVAPKGKENLFVLVPLPAGVYGEESELEQYAEKMIKKIEVQLGIPNFAERIEYRRYFGPRDFQTQFNAHKGTALGMAHTLFQTAPFRPHSRSKKVSNLYYVGSDTHPGIGMPVCLIGAQLVRDRIRKEQK